MKFGMKDFKSGFAQKPEGPSLITLHELPVYTDSFYFLNYKKLIPSFYNHDLGYYIGIEEDNQIVSLEGTPLLYRFPINPSNISVDVPTATTTEVTMKGIVETHNAAPLRRISISGTTGVLPVLKMLQNQEDKSSSASRVLDYAFKNTIRSLNSLSESANRLVKTAETGLAQQVSSPLNKKDLEEADLLSTGYAQIHELKRLLDLYISGKKEIQNKKWRLVFIMAKDDEKWYCTLNSYSIQKAAGTIEYNYSIQLTAWRRTTPDFRLISGKRITPTKTASNALLNFINIARQARQTLSKSLNILSGIRADVQESFITPVGEVVLLLKDVMGVAVTLADLSFTKIVGDLEGSFKSLLSSRSDILESTSAKTKELGLISSQNANGTSNSAIKDSVDIKINDGRPENYISPEETADPIKVIINDPSKYPEIFDLVELDALEISDEVQAEIDKTKETVRSFTTEDILERKGKIVSFSRSVSEALGGGSTTYSRVMGQNNIKKIFKKLTVDDIILLNELNNIIMNMDSLAAAMDKAKAEVSEDYYTFYKDYAVSAGLTFSTEMISKFYVPFPFGATLEQMALQYLGDADRWIELAALNSLKAPYVDEKGFTVKVTSSSGGDTLSVATDEGFYIGQIVEVFSDTQPSTVRKVRRIDVVNAAQTLITFETTTGLSLTKYKPSENALIKMYMPNTVNSNMLLAIPSDAAPNQQGILKVTPEIDDLNKLARIAKIDILLDTQGDWILSGGGDVKLATGLTNITQAAMLKLKTKTNTLLQAPEFGNPVEAGDNTSEITANSVAEALNESFAEDPRFDGIVGIKVDKKGTSIEISSLVNIANTDISLPISAELPKLNTK